MNSSKKTAMYFMYIVDVVTLIISFCMAYLVKFNWIEGENNIHRSDYIILFLLISIMYILINLIFMKNIDFINRNITKEVIETVTGGGKRVGSVILVDIAPFIKELYLHLLRRYIARQHPEVAQGAIRVIVAPIGIAVFQENIAVLVHIVIPTATTGSGIEVENHFIVGLLQHGIKQSA